MKTNCCRFKCVILNIATIAPFYELNDVLYVNCVQVGAQDLYQIC